MIDFEYSLEVAKYLIIYPILVITSVSAVYSFLKRTRDNFERDKSRALDIRICKCGGLYWENDRQKTTKTTKNDVNHMEINGNLYASVNGVDDNETKTSQTKIQSPSKFLVNLNNNQNNIRSRNNDDSIVLRNVHKRHVVSAMKEMFEHNNGVHEQSNGRTLSPARTNINNNNRTPVKTNLLKYFGGDQVSPSTTTIKQGSDDKVQRRTLLRNNRPIGESTTVTKKNRLSQCSISELLDQLNDPSDLQELCKEFVETSPSGVKPSEIHVNGTDPVQLRTKSVSFESLPGSKRLSLYSSSPSSSHKTSRPMSTENLLNSLSLSNPNLNDILTAQEIYDAILQTKNFDSAISFDDLLHADELSRCLSEYSITELLKEDEA